ncbi:MAG: hypothetical protein EP330_05480 [Deltaproteobacteria bacterium]|nr:MAG: hypothetical protein EP330_05480 [Deltaproteobacteria bacterium]
MTSLLFALLLACGGSSTTGPSTDDLAKLSDEQVARKTLAYMEQVATAGKAHAPDCDAMATAMKPVVDEHRALIELTSRYRSDPEKSAWFDAHYGDQAKPHMEWLIDTMRQCGENANMRAVSDQMFR